ncbi:MAG: hypothetical protein KAG61_07740 [Bacteriovoracaceae bacterium]|nr:hypothetical protein [Bacteriovoracaceae bacterium]
MLPCITFLLIPVLSYLLVKGGHRTFKFSSTLINPITSLLTMLGVISFSIGTVTFGSLGGFAVSNEFFSINLWSNGFRILVALYLSFAMLFCSYIEYNESEDKLFNSIERYFLLSSSFMVVFSANFFTTIIGVTLMTLSLIHIGAVNSRENIRGIINFYIRKEISDFFLIVGVLLLALFGKTFDYIDLGEALVGLNNKLGSMALVFIVLWFLIRLRIFPFISLKQSFLESIKSPLKAIFICIYLPAIVTPFLSFTSLLDETIYSQPILFTLGILSTFIYGIMALFSIRLKDLLIYFTYAQYGVAVIGISVGAYIDAGLYLVFLSALVLIWFSLNKLLEREGVKEISQLTKLGRRYTKLKILLGTLIALLAGIPMLGIFGMRSEIMWSITNSTLGHSGVALFLFVYVISTAAIARVFVALVCKRDQHLITARKYQNWQIVVSGGVLFLVIGISIFTISDVIIPGNSLILLEYLRNDFIEGRIFFASNTVHYISIAVDQLLTLAVFGAMYFIIATKRGGPIEKVARKFSVLIDYYRRYYRYSDESLRKTTTGIQYASKKVFHLIDEKLFSTLSGPVERSAIIVGKLNKWSIARFDCYIGLVTAGIVLFIIIIGLSFIIEGP